MGILIGVKEVDIFGKIYLIAINFNQLELEL